MGMANGGIRLLLERIGTIPSYMTLSDSQVENLTKSFFNIFQTIIPSIKLLGDTLALNINVIQATISGDKAKVEEAFDKFGVERAKYDEEVKKHLKYFEEFYKMGGIDGLAGFGPPFLLFAANPLMYLAISNADEDGSAPTPQKERPKSDDAQPSMNPTLARALAFFGFTGVSRKNLSEAVDIDGIDPDVVKEAEKLQGVAKSYVENEKRIADDILKMLSNRVAFIKKVAESKNFEELKGASAMASSVGIKWEGAAIEKSYKKIEGDLKEKQGQDPEGFKKSVEDVKKMSPEVSSMEDLEAIKTVAFGMAKSQVQDRLVAAYNDIVASVNKTMGLPLDPSVEQKLLQNEIGRDYLKVLQDFSFRLETGSREVQKLKK